VAWRDVHGLCVHVRVQQGCNEAALPERKAERCRGGQDAAGH
jgi:hypothetical protein